MAVYLTSINDDIVRSACVRFRKKCAIPGLEGRQLDFLGLMNCPYEASRREDLPAERVSIW